MLRDFPESYHEPGSQFAKAEEHPCEVGHYSKEGIRYKCAGGTYGDKEMEVNSDCSGICEAGYYCPYTTCPLPVSLCVCLISLVWATLSHTDGSPLKMMVLSSEQLDSSKENFHL